jgi:hypothetical protein
MFTDPVKLEKLLKFTDQVIYCVIAMFFVGILLFVAAINMKY